CELHTYIIEPGEQSKSEKVLFDLLTYLQNLKASRKQTLIVALGGGVVTDLAGFAASIYQRGVSVVHIPTTLLAQADAAIGGKTGIDFHGKKNFIGTLYPLKQLRLDSIFFNECETRE